MNADTLRADLSKRLAIIRSAAVTLSICLLAMLAAWFQPVTAALEFNREGILRHEWWRILGGHVTHWNTDHLLWDALMFAVLGVFCERRSRPRFLACLALASLAISGAIWWLQPAADSYRGLSGIDSALFTMAAAAILADARRNRDRAAGVAALAMLVAFAGKLAYEILTGATLFVNATSAGFVPLPLAHVAGGCAGLVVFQLGEFFENGRNKLGALKNRAKPSMI